MSHATVLVALDSPTDIEAQLEELLAPYDENTEVEPYAQRIDDRDLEFARSFYTKHPEHWKATVPAADAADIVVLAHYHSENVIQREDGYYRMATYNPSSKWDWWAIGGRWSGYFDVVPGCQGEVTLLQPKHDWNTPEVDDMVGKVNGGPRRCLDLAAMRKAARDRAAYRYDKVHAVIDQLPPLEHDWAKLVDRARDETDPLDFDMARGLWHSQPRIKALNTEKMRGEIGFFASVEEYEIPKRTYLDRAEAGAVPGHAFLSKETGWVEPGRMLMFGASTDTESDRIGYWEHINGHIDKLPDDAFLVIIDYHI